MGAGGDAGGGRDTRRQGHKSGAPPDQHRGGMQYVGGGRGLEKP